MRANVSICHNAHCSHIVVLLATSVLRCNNSQRKHRLCQFIIHLDAFFSYIYFAAVHSALTAACRSIPAQTTGPSRPDVRKYSSHP